MTPKEALEVIGGIEVGYVHSNISHVFEDEYNAVEQALTELEEMKKIHEKKDKLLELYQRYIELGGIDLEANYIWHKIKELEEELKK
jgi:hypothetical protein